MNIVWFKRDLRIVDHEALTRAAQLGPVLPLYILEPELWQQPDLSYRHYAFLTDCLTELEGYLRALGQNLIIKVGSAVDVLQDIAERYPIQALWSHQETWNGWTYQRDLKVKRWCEDRHIQWVEPMQQGVVRRLRDRDGWSLQWYKHMKKPIFSPPTSLETLREASDPLPHPHQLGLIDHHGVKAQKGGRLEGLKLLNSFLLERGENYTKEMSSPLAAFDSCSRLSAHFAFGTLSIREAFQATEKRNQELQNEPLTLRGKWPSALRSFSGRLRWHCHFIQKLEDEPRIEFEHMHPAYEGLREDAFNEEFFNAWKIGLTGYPMVDACMRALIATGWLNFRMRAMLMSFASYHLWLDWRRPAVYLASLFTDYEPGIHYSQVQMQSGTTGINAIRIYNPIKQGMDQDPQGIFIRRWIPELRDIDSAFIHTPWSAHSNIKGYPMPIVDEKSARKAAADRIYSLRKNNLRHKEAAQKIVKKHASRSSGISRKSAKKTNTHPGQGELFS